MDWVDTVWSKNSYCYNFTKLLKLLLSGCTCLYLNFKHVHNLHVQYQLLSLELTRLTSFFPYSINRKRALVL